MRAPKGNSKDNGALLDGKCDTLLRFSRVPLNLFDRDVPGL